MNRWLAVAVATMLVVLGLLASTGWAQDEAATEDPAVPQAIQDMYSVFYLAAQSGDRSSAVACMTEMARVQSQIAGQSRLDDPLRMSEAWALTQVEPRFLWWAQVGDRALVEYDLLIRGTDRKTGDPVSLTWRRLDSVERQGLGWRLREMSALDVDRQTRDIGDTTIKDEEYGMEAAIPADWGAYVTKGAAGFIGQLQAPDLLTSIQVVAQDLPLKITAREAAETEEQQLNGPGMSYQRILAEETTLDGKPAYRIDAVITVLGVPSFSRRVYRIDSVDGRDIAYALVLSADTQEQASKYEAEFEAVRQSTRITAPQAMVLAPEFGKLVGDQYLNARYQVSARVPQGWTGRAQKRMNLFEFSVIPPDYGIELPPSSLRVVLLTAVDVGQWVDPKLAAESSIEALRGVHKGLEVIRQEPLERDGLMGYDSILRYADETGMMHYTRQVYFARDTLIFVVVAEVSPQEAWDRMVPGIDELVASVSFQPIEEDAPVEEQ